jgi:uncharacterized membrane protein
MNFFQMTPPHAILIHFPLALIPAAFAADVLGRWFKNISLSHTGWWAILFATLAAPLTAASGWIWMRQMADMDHAELVYHKWLGISLAMLLIPLAAWRFRLHRRQGPASGAYLVVLAIALLGVMVQGHLGGMMTFGNEPAADEAATSQPAENHGHDHHHMDNAAPATTQSEQDGWGNSIKVKEHHHE